MCVYVYIIYIYDEFIYMMNFKKIMLSENSPFLFIKYKILYTI